MNANVVLADSKYFVRGHKFGVGFGHAVHTQSPAVGQAEPDQILDCRIKFLAKFRSDVVNSDASPTAE